MRSTIPWRGARKKDLLFLQMLIESTTQVGDVVVDYTASTGKEYLVNLSIMAL
jgi:hypothetical protein